MAAPGRDIPLATPDDAPLVIIEEIEAFLAALRSLDAGDWAKPTDCPPWTVQQVAAHVLGQWEGAAKVRVFLRRHRIGHRRYPSLSRLAALTQQQVDDLGPLPPAELISRLTLMGPKAIRAMRRVPGFVRRMNITRFFPEDPLPDLRLGYIFDVIAARDTWMHRLDIMTATGRPMVLANHDKEIVAQVVRTSGWPTCAPCPAATTPPHWRSTATRPSPGRWPRPGPCSKPAWPPPSTGTRSRRGSSRPRARRG